jgi:hypothetical protein
MEQYTYVYFIDGVPVYVGKGKDKRALSHITRPLDTRWGQYLFASIQAGHKVEVKLVFWADSDAAVKAEEIRLIAFYGRRDRGTGSLYNLTSGGQGTVGCSRPSHRKGKALPESHRAALKAAHVGMTGRRHTPETRARMAAAAFARAAK